MRSAFLFGLCFSALLFSCGIKEERGATKVTLGEIVDGNFASKRDFPWQVSLRSDEGLICGGVIVSKRHILTAGHCLHRRLPGDYSVFSRNGEWLGEIESHEIHQYFLRAILRNDIAMITLENPLVFKEDIQPVNLPKPRVSRDELLYSQEIKQFLVAGWGRTEREKASEKLRSVDTLKPLPAHDDSYWSEEMISKHFLGDESRWMSYNEQFIAFEKLGRQGVCDGDSGGPITRHDQNGQVTLIGIASFVSRPCEKVEGGVNLFVNVQYSLDWIMERI